MDFPIIDIARIDDPDHQLAIARKITEASRTWGFLLLKNHSIPAEEITEMFRLSREFFIDVPEEQKAQWLVNEQSVGYNAPLSDVSKDDKASMWLAGKPGYLAGEGHDALPPYWRDKIGKIETFKHSCHEVVTKLLVCFALAMGLPDRNYFAKAHAEDAGNGITLRLICYPSRKDDPSSVSTRMSPHSDGGSVTLLFQTCPGLEVESPSGDSWVPAPHIDDHILVNLGDALAFWSGGQVKATKHRVTFEHVPHNVERLSMAYFGKASPDTVLQPLEVEGAKPMDKYEANGLVIPAGITVGEYTNMVMAGIYGFRQSRPESVPAA